MKSIEYLRNNIKAKNLKYNFLRFDKEKNIEVFENAGWHFNNIMSPEQISLKLKTFAHTEFNSKEFYSVENIRNREKTKIPPAVATESRAATFPRLRRKSIVTKEESKGSKRTLRTTDSILSVL